MGDVGANGEPGDIGFYGQRGIPGKDGLPGEKNLCKKIKLIIINSFFSSLLIIRFTWS